MLWSSRLYNSRVFHGCDTAVAVVAAVVPSTGRSETAVRASPECPEPAATVASEPAYYCSFTVVWIFFYLVYCSFTAV